MIVKEKVAMPLSIVALYLVTKKNCVATDEYSSSIWFNHEDDKFYVKSPKVHELNPFVRFIETLKDLWSFKLPEQELEKYKNWKGEYKVQVLPVQQIVEDKYVRSLTLEYEVEDE